MKEQVADLPSHPTLKFRVKLESDIALHHGKWRCVMALYSKVEYVENGAVKHYTQAVAIADPKLKAVFGGEDRRAKAKLRVSLDSLNLSCLGFGTRGQPVWNRPLPHYFLEIYFSREDGVKIPIVTANGGQQAQRISALSEMGEITWKEKAGRWVGHVRTDVQVGLEAIGAVAIAETAEGRATIRKPAKKHAMQSESDLEDSE